MDSLQTILFFCMKWNFFHLATVVFFPFLSQVNGMYCAVYHICMNTLFLLLLLLLLLHDLLLLLVLLVTCSGNERTFLSLWICVRVTSSSFTPIWTRGWQKVPSPTLLLWTMLLREGLGFVFHPVDFFLSFVDAEERLPHASAKPLPWHEVWYSLFRVEALQSLWFTSRHRKLFLCA